MICGRVPGALDWEKGEGEREGATGALGLRCRKRCMQSIHTGPPMRAVEIVLLPGVSPGETFEPACTARRHSCGSFMLQMASWTVLC